MQGAFLVVNRGASESVVRMADGSFAVLGEGKEIRVNERPLAHSRKVVVSPITRRKEALSEQGTEKKAVPVKPPVGNSEGVK